MYLSKIELNRNAHAVRRDLGDCHQLHKTVMCGFPDRPKISDQKNNECRKEWQILYRLEGTTLLVQSGIEPNWDCLPTGYYIEGVKELDFQGLQPGDLLKFRLVANPVKQLTKDRTDENGQVMLKPDGSKKPQKKTLRRLITKQEDQIEWLQNKLKGTRLRECYMAAPGKIKRQGRKAAIQTIQFDGVLEVTIPSDFLDVLGDGVGRGRSYGCGLVSIAKL